MTALPAPCDRFEPCAFDPECRCCDSCAWLEADHRRPTASDHLAAITECVRAAWERGLAKQPWWCAWCGESGNGYDPNLPYIVRSEHGCDPELHLTGFRGGAS